MNLEIRACRVSDAARLYEIQQLAFAHLEGFQMREWRSHEFVEVLKAFTGWAALDESGDVQAYVLWQELRDSCEILHLATDPAQWGKQLMTQLLQFVIDQKLGNRELWLEVHEMNRRAIGLYEKLGFKRCGFRPQFYRDGGGAILYKMERFGG